MVVQINGKDEFEEIVMKDEGKSIVDFYALWCGPCRMLESILESITEENEDITIYKVNIDENPELANEFMVSSIPTIMLMNKGDKIETLIGLRSKEDILSYFN